MNGKTINKTIDCSIRLISFLKYETAVISYGDGYSLVYNTDKG